MVFYVYEILKIRLQQHKHNRTIWEIKWELIPKILK